MTNGMLNRLVGAMPEVMLPNPLDYITDGFVGALEEVGEKIAGTMSDWATWGTRTAIEILSNDLLPEVDTFFSGPVSVLFGANYGLSLVIMRSLVVVAALVTMVAMFRQKRTEFAGRILSSLIYLFVFSVLFLPVYTLLLSSIRKIGTVVLQNAAGISGGTLDTLPDSLSRAMSVQQLPVQFLGGLVNGIWGTVLVVELAAMVIVGVLLVIFYPLSVSFKAFGRFGLNQFRYATAAVITVPVSLVLMIGVLALELVLIRSAGDIAPFLGGFSALILSSVFGLIIVLLPFLVFGLAFSKVEEVVGNSDTRIQSAIDIATMPDINSRDIGGENTRDRLRYVRDFTSELPAAIAAGENSPVTEAKELGKQIAIKAATTSSNPVIGGIGVAYTGYKVVQKVVESQQNRGGELDE